MNNARFVDPSSCGIAHHLAPFSDSSPDCPVPCAETRPGVFRDHAGLNPRRCASSPTFLCHVPVLARTAFSAIFFSRGSYSFHFLKCLLRPYALLISNLFLLFVSSFFFLFLLGLFPPFLSLAPRVPVAQSASPGVDCLCRFSCVPSVPLPYHFCPVDSAIVLTRLLLLGFGEKKRGRPRQASCCLALSLSVHLTYRAGARTSLSGWYRRKRCGRSSAVESDRFGAVPVLFRGSSPGSHGGRPGKPATVHEFENLHSQAGKQSRPVRGAGVDRRRGPAKLYLPGIVLMSFSPGFPHRFWPDLVGLTTTTFGKPRTKRPLPANPLIGSYVHLGVETGIDPHKAGALIAHGLCSPSGGVLPRAILARIGGKVPPAPPIFFQKTAGRRRIGAFAATIPRDHVPRAAGGKAHDAGARHRTVLIGFAGWRAGPLPHSQHRAASKSLQYGPSGVFPHLFCCHPIIGDGTAR